MDTHYVFRQSLLLLKFLFIEKLNFFIVIIWFIIQLFRHSIKFSFYKSIQVNTLIYFQQESSRPIIYANRARTPTHICIRNA